MMWDFFSYYEVLSGRLSAAECERVIALSQGSAALRSVMPNRDSDLFWIPRSADTDWLFERVWDTVIQYNYRYGFELSREMGQLQLTRYDAGQLYDWHMDLGPGEMSLRKISIVIDLTSPTAQVGGGIEVFYGEMQTRVSLGQGDACVFPSFIMHRALPVQRGTRWSLVSWLTGPSPLN